MHKITRELLSQHLIFDFATKYHYENEAISSPNAFEITDAIYEEFVAYVNSKAFDYDSDAEKAVKRFDDSLKDEAYYDKLTSDLEHIRKEINAHRKRDIYAHRKEITRYLKTEIAARYYYDAGRREADFKEDTDVLAAVEALEDSAAYQAVFEDMETLSKRKDDTQAETAEASDNAEDNDNDED